MTISFQFSHIKSLKLIAHVVPWFVKYYESALDEEMAWCQMPTSHFFNQCGHSHMTQICRYWPQGVKLQLLVKDVSSYEMQNF